MAGLVLEFSIEFTKDLKITNILFLNDIKINDGKIYSTKVQYCSVDQEGQITLDEEPKYAEIQFKLLNDQIEKEEE